VAQDAVLISGQQPLGWKPAGIETPKPEAPGHATANAHREAAQFNEIVSGRPSSA